MLSLYVYVASLFDRPCLDDVLAVARRDNVCLWGGRGLILACLRNHAVKTLGLFEVKRSDHITSSI